jgi:N-acetylglucosamine kinase-like BadF-type ATPase
VKFVAGIDGGQSSTIAVVVDDDGVVRGRGSGGPSDHVGQAPDSPRAALACEHALRRALAAAQLPAETPLAAVVIGLSGYEGSWHGRPPAFMAERVRYVHDAPIALAGAIARRPAGVVIAGTGSAGYGEDPSGRAVRAGGYGYLFGDAGSGFAIARSALAAAMTAADRGVTTDLATAALAFFDVPDLRAFVRAVSLHQIDRPQIAGFARVVADAARLGDSEARTIVDQAAAALAGLAHTIADRLTTISGGAVPVALVGGLAASPLIEEAVRSHVGPTSAATIVAAAHEPAIGAAFLAFDDANLPRPRIQPIPA